MGLPGGSRQEITETDALKYRLAISKDKGIQDEMRALEDKKKILAQQEEIIRLKINLIRMENNKEIGHLQIENGDQLTTENGKYYIQRAPRQGPIPFPGKPVADQAVEQPPEPSELPVEPQNGKPPQEEPQGGPDEGSGAGEAPPTQPPAQA
jgi:hypothetical protein